jgi:hypothetical protein
MLALSCEHQGQHAFSRTYFKDAVAGDEWNYSAIFLRNLAADYRGLVLPERANPLIPFLSLAERPADRD